MPDSASARAFVFERPRRLVLHELPLPTVGADDALVRVQACGLCGTYHEQYTGELAGGFAFVPGHETIGIVETIGRRWRSCSRVVTARRGLCAAAAKDAGAEVVMMTGICSPRWRASAATCRQCTGW